MKPTSLLRWAKIDSFVGNRSAPELTYYRPCPICGSLKTKVVLALNDFQFYSDSADIPKRADLQQRICLNCFALYLNPCYSDYGFRVLFEEAGQSYGSTEGHPQEQVNWFSTRGLLDKGMRVLDVGCYDGAFLARLPEHVTKLGVDIDKPAIERGRDLHRGQGTEFFLGDFETFPYTGPPPDLITMFHVLEHLPRPVEVLKKLRSIAKPQTRLVVEVPVIEDGKTNDINGFFSVMHTTHFSKWSLKNCLFSGGWEISESLIQKEYNGYRVLASPRIDCDSKNFAASLSDSLQLKRYLSFWYQSIAEAEKK